MIRTLFPLFGTALLGSAIAIISPLAAADTAVGDVPVQHASHGDSTPSTLVAKVREATDAFRRVIPKEYTQFLGCVSGPEVGAMGVHFVNFDLVDGNPEPNHPEALIYEMKDGRARLVGVEFIVPAAAWDPTHSEPPQLEGQVFHFNDSPNRFKLPAFYELHVWAWRDNPNGTFVDWNPSVSCDGQ